MNDKPKPSRAGQLLREIAALSEGDSARRRQVDRWLTNLAAAERTAAARPIPKTFMYLVNYRVESADSSTKGTPAQRRGALIELIDSLKPREQHLSTSSWLIVVHIARASELIQFLSPPLAQDDFLGVAQVSPSNRAVVGDANLD